MVVVCSINKQTSCNYEIFKIIQIFWLFCQERIFWVYALYINLQMQNCGKSWVTLNVFKGSQITKKFFKLSIDLLASRKNLKVARYLAFYPYLDAFIVDSVFIYWKKGKILCLSFILQFHN